mmetsp:Transcript_19146/g.30754  ORF Transcript_19146/g.30754 Transcript_19146/m.30754 type:complete len:155 (-) Transcript_19146:90-554(-)
MTSIQAAIYQDTRKGNAPAKNFVALTSKQENAGVTTNDDFHQRLQERRTEERQRRMAEGGRAGGYMDRQDPADRASSSSRVEDEEYDDFGRRKTGAANTFATKSSRNQAALERLRQNALKKSSAQNATSHVESGRDRSRSQKKERSRSRSRRRR